jgi:hypothetical protein
MNAAVAGAVMVLLLPALLAMPDDVDDVVSSTVPEIAEVSNVVLYLANQSRSASLLYNGFGRTVTMSSNDGRIQTRLRVLR